MPVIYSPHIPRAVVQANRDTLFVFGDNLQRVGLGGQASAMRGEPNSVGVATKKAPGMNPGDFYTDAELAQNIRQFHEDTHRIIEHLAQGGRVVVPADGIGTGLSEMPKRAPMTYDYFHHMLFFLWPRTFPQNLKG